jgi:serine/threonine-protein kinase RsbT
MTTCSYALQGGDYQRAGSASRSLKEVLKSLGADPQLLRRIMVASYEAEMNVVIHATSGTLKAFIDGCEIKLEVEDRGPGIADIQLAMKEGYSTAPARARELGFGAGLGLPNIKKHSDRFCIESVIGQGTRVQFAFVCEALQDKARPARSMQLRAERCRQCLRCIHACPTLALRVHRSAPHLLAHLCIECTQCMASCPDQALSVEDPPADPQRTDTLVIPPAFLFRTPFAGRAQLAMWGLHQLGYRHVVRTDPWQRAHRAEVLGYAIARDSELPVVSSACPAIIALVETRFPSLLGELAPHRTALESAVLQLGAGASAVVLCPAQRTALLDLGVEPHRILTPRSLDRQLAPHMTAAARSQPLASPVTGPQPPDTAAARTGQDGARCAEDRRLLRVEGIRWAIQALDQIEDGRLRGPKVVELYACAFGCFGSGLLLDASPAIDAYRHSCEPTLHTQAQVALRTCAYAARSGLRLDADITQAMDKLARINTLLGELPSRDCGACGAPTCRAFAEDVVLERIPKRACPHAVSGKAGVG